MASVVRYATFLAVLLLTVEHGAVALVEVTEPVHLGASGANTDIAYSQASQFTRSRPLGAAQSARPGQQGTPSPHKAPAAQGGELPAGAHRTSLAGGRSAGRRLRAQWVKASLKSQPGDSTLSQGRTQHSSLAGADGGPVSGPGSSLGSTAAAWDFEDQASGSTGDGGASDRAGDAHSGGASAAALAPGAEGSVAMCLVVREQHKDIVEVRARNLRL